MTATEFSAELDTIYENINKNGAPGLDDYEKSVILSHAQELLIKEYIKVNPSGDEFPDLIDVYTTSSVTAGVYGENSYMFPLPVGYLKVLNERVENSGGDTLIVLSISHDQFQEKVSKAYKYPPRRRAWRLMVDDSVGKAEIYTRSGFTATNYVCRYIRKPIPIILTDLTLLTPPASIDGLTAITQSELDTGWHRDILKIAATLAEQYYMDKYNTNESRGN